MATKSWPAWSRQFLEALEEVRVKLGLDGRARLAGDEEERAGAAASRQDRGRVGAVEHVQLQAVVAHAETAQDLRREARAAHAQQHRVAEAGAAHILDERFDLWERRARIRDATSSQPSRLATDFWRAASPPQNETSRRQMRGSRILGYERRCERIDPAPGSRPAARLSRKFTRRSPSRAISLALAVVVSMRICLV